MTDQPSIREIFWEESHTLLARMEEALSRVHREPAAAAGILETFSGGPVTGEFVGLFADARARMAH